MLTLKIKKRDTKADLGKLRESGLIPAVFYGKKVESTPISISAVDFKKVWKEAGTSSLVVLSGVDKDKESLIYDVEISPVSHQANHVDFYIIERGKPIEVDVPLEFIGTAPAVKELGGILVKVMHELKVEVLPKDLPQNISVDVSSLVDLDSQILIKDIKLPAGVTVLAEEDEVIAAISQAAEESGEATPIDISGVEVEKKGKKEVVE